MGNSRVEMQWNVARHATSETLPIEQLSSRINVSAMLEQFGVSASPNPIRDRVRHAFVRHQVPVIERFYAFWLAIPETRALLSHAPLAALKEHQAQYWRSLFSAPLDQTFAARSIAVGFAHCRIGLSLGIRIF